MTRPSARVQRWQIGAATVTRIEAQLVPDHNVPALDALVTSVRSLIQTAHHLLQSCAPHRISQFCMFPEQARARYSFRRLDIDSRRSFFPGLTARRRVACREPAKPAMTAQLARC